MRRQENKVAVIYGNGNVGAGIAKAFARRLTGYRFISAAKLFNIKIGKKNKMLRFPFPGGKNSFFYGGMIKKE